MPNFCERLVWTAEPEGGGEYSCKIGLTGSLDNCCIIDFIECGSKCKGFVNGGECP